MSHVFLIGFMGAGKSTVGVRVAETLGRPFVDLDREIESDAGMAIAEVFAQRGEGGFRDLETVALTRLEAREPLVVACGGGIVERQANRDLLAKEGTVVYLRVSTAETLARCGSDPNRPLLRGGPEAIEALLSARESLYAAAADVVVDTVGLDASQVADRVSSELEGLIA
jgi:shikimate kinase